MKKIKRTLFLTLALSLVISAWFSTPMTAFATENEPTHNTGSISSTELGSAPNQSISFFSFARYYSSNSAFSNFGSLLNEIEKRFYNALCQITPNDDIIYVSFDHDLTEEEFSNLEIQRVAEAFYLDNPETFWFPTFEISYSYYTTDNTTYYYGFAIIPNIDHELYPNPNDSLYTINSRINSLPLNKTNRYETLKDIQAYLCETITYGGTNDREHTIAGALIDNTAVCEGYAEAFKLICDSQGIPCICVIGKAARQNHMWNAVQMEDGNWYLVDTTWDDTTPVQYNYFLAGLSTVINGGKFSESHKTSNSHGLENSLTLVYPSFSDTAFDISYYDSIIVECPHENTIVTNGKEATCVENGYTASTTCEDCGETLVASETIPATNNHSYGAWTTNISPSCATEGSQQRTCETCGNTETESIGALGHSYSNEWTIDTQATCEKNGSKSHHCTRCDAKTDVTVIPATNQHQLGEWVIDKAANCTTTGLKYKSCLNCSYTETESIDALGHNYSTEWTIDTQATCVKEGSKSHHCIRCDTKTDVTIIPATNEHQLGKWIIDEAATCITKGAQRKTCSDCDYFIVEIIPENDNHRGGKATCTQKATCIDCGEVYGDYDMNSHQEAKAGKQSAHTHCERCGVTLSEKHTFTENITKEATAVEKGIKTYTCDCGYSYTTDIEKIGAGEVKVEANKENDFSATINETADVKSKIQVTNEEQNLINKGLDLKIVLKLKNADKKVDTKEKEIIVSQLSENVLGFFLDIKLSKQIGTYENNIENTNGEIKVSFEMPKELINTDKNVEREYKVIRYHENDVEKITVLDATFDKNTNQLTFATDRFSTYAVVYTDTVTNTDTITETTQETVTETGKDDVPKAGIISTTVLWFGGMTLSGLGAIALSKKKEEDE